MASAESNPQKVGKGPRQRMRFDLQRALFILPNLFTLSSIFCGFYSIVVSTTEPTDKSFETAALLIVFAMFFDTVDGRVARLTKTQSAFGVQIDSLADVVSFGAATSILIYRWSLHALGPLGALISFVFLACGAIRLARFNVLAAGAAGAPKAPSKYMVGLPIPGAAGVLVCTVVANYALTGRLHTEPWTVVAVTLVLSFFMVSTIPFRSFKDIRYSTRTLIVALTVASVAGWLAWAYHPAFALVCLLVGYMMLAVIESALQFGRKLQGAAPPALAQDSKPPGARE